VLLKSRGPEATSSEAAEVISSEAASSEVASSEAISPEAENQLDLQEHSKIEESTLQKLSIEFENTNKGLVEFATVISKVFEGMCLHFGRKR
jgi:hypothetical protein